MCQSTEIKNKISKNLRNVSQSEPRVSPSQSPVSRSSFDLEWSKQVTSPSICSFNAFGLLLHFTQHHGLHFIYIYIFFRQSNVGLFD